MEIAESLRRLKENAVVSAALDKGTGIDGAIEATHAAWGIDLLRRNPSPAFLEDEGELVYGGTDLDAFTFLSVLADRRAVINLPSYEGMRPRAFSDTERVLSSENRHGELHEIISNEKTHAFSTRIKDYNVVLLQPDGSETVGAWRNFSVVNDFGEWHDGWRTIEFRSTPEETEFMEGRGLYSGPDTITFHSFVHPNLAGAFQGARYLSTKALEGRITDEKRSHSRLARALREEGISLPEDEEPIPYSGRTQAPGKKEVVQALEARLVLPSYGGEYRGLGQRQDGEIYGLPDTATSESRMDALRYAERRTKEMRLAQTRLRSRIRAVEFAFFRHGRYDDGTEKDPGWAVPGWIREYKETPRSRTLWNALPLADDTALLYRVRDVTVIVADRDE